MTPFQGVDVGSSPTERNVFPFCSRGIKTDDGGGGSQRHRFHRLIGVPFLEPPNSTETAHFPTVSFRRVCLHTPTFHSPAPPEMSDNLKHSNALLDAMTKILEEKELDQEELALWKCIWQSWLKQPTSLLDPGQLLTAIVHRIVKREGCASQAMTLLDLVLSEPRLLPTAPENKALRLAVSCLNEAVVRKILAHPNATADFLDDSKLLYACARRTLEGKKSESMFLLLLEYETFRPSPEWMKEELPATAVRHLLKREHVRESDHCGEALARAVKRKDYDVADVIWACPKANVRSAMKLVLEAGTLTDAKQMQYIDTWSTSSRVDNILAKPSALLQCADYCPWEHVMTYLLRHVDEKQLSEEDKMAVIERAARGKHETLIGLLNHSLFRSCTGFRGAVTTALRCFACPALKTLLEDKRTDVQWMLRLTYREVDRLFPLVNNERQLELLNTLLQHPTLYQAPAESAFRLYVESYRTQFKDRLREFAPLPSSSTTVEATAEQKHIQAVAAPRISTFSDRLKLALEAVCGKEASIAVRPLNRDDHAEVYYKDQTERTFKLSFFKSFVTYEGSSEWYARAAEIIRDQRFVERAGAYHLSSTSSAPLEKKLAPALPSTESPISCPTQHQQPCSSTLLRPNRLVIDQLRIAARVAPEPCSLTQRAVRDERPFVERVRSTLSLIFGTGAVCVAKSFSSDSVVHVHFNGAAANIPTLDFWLIIDANQKARFEGLSDYEDLAELIIDHPHFVRAFGTYRLILKARPSFNDYVIGDYHYLLSTITSGRSSTNQQKQEACS